ncbi:putative MAP kinase kinase [Monocercomonoides exilis]|uniref:putative MAP kinase kinase n=1 Tax=Monocercomonoides exilis TaxID=2049356 RepID=UPI00355ABB14|nr:putative MAP kinase kinase [Monocercomonoides exilis]|eukprot:MONOS_4503.1-p1 / transcript=MONOS_4503.1 / gene=MONOS_4503 / organism=Monocercomonoides_exilis_PA203 / gene_product=MAP kinase kinase / transcript_product=MAP kinase kinase / location=Mono_scaffold00120:80109-82779(+) / protein_length=372 / sequence_SO=supercontig / SO=protein_coding / is_pseudo=false
MAVFVGKRKPPPLICTEDSIKIDNKGDWSEGSFIVGRMGLTDKKKETTVDDDLDDSFGKPLKYSLDSLEQLDLIGFGSSGRVYHVIQKDTKEDFALKVIPMDCTKAVRKQLLDEIRALSRLCHPAIVNCPDAFLVDGVLYILLEYFDCGSLADALKITGPVPERIVACFSKQILSAISFCHKQKYIHRDLKPANFLLNSKGMVKIADFGTSSRLQGNTSAASTWVGTVTYMSPERITGTEYTFESDIWSFGLTMFELAVNHYPYPPADLDGRGGQMGFWDLLDLIVQKPSPALPEDSFSKEFCDFIAKCLEKEADKRYNADQLLAHPFLSDANCASLDETAAWLKPFVGRISESVRKAAADALDGVTGEKED